MPKIKFSSQRPRIVVYTSLRLRLMTMFTVLYAIAYFGSFTVLHALGQRIVNTAISSSSQIVSPDAAEQLANLITTQVRAVQIPAFIVSYGILLLVLFFTASAITRPLRALTRYAERVGHGDYAPTKIPNFPFIHDEITTLTEVFELMVSRVRERELVLQARVKELEIHIDETKKAKQVEEIVDSEFFSNLKDQVRDLKARKKPVTSPDNPATL
jgi:methyl-accepting chemotaxis protein